MCVVLASDQQGWRAEAVGVDVFHPSGDSGETRDEIRGCLVDALWVGKQLLDVTPRGWL